jgi:ABC-2 type transport system ATP-binding protein
MQALMGAVAETGTTVLLSSHLLADLERACDYLIVLQTAHVQLSGPVDELLEDHRTLVGPRTETDRVPGVAEVIRASHTDRQSTLLARVDGIGPADPAWSVHEVTLEDLVLAYLAKADTRSTRTAWEVNA